MNQETQPATKKCPYCAEEILSEALKCKHCGEWLDGPNIHRTQLAVKGYSNAQPPWKLILLSIITFSFYELYWFYRNWNHLKNYRNLDISPGWRTIGLFVPIYNIFLVYEQFKDIKDFAFQAGCKTYSSAGWITFGYISLNAISILLSKYTDSAETILLGLLIDLLGLLLLVIVQKTLNEYWTKEQPEFKMRKNFSTGELVILVIGGFLWLLILIGIFIPEPSNPNLQL